MRRAEVEPNNPPVRRSCLATIPQTLEGDDNKCWQVSWLSRFLSRLPVRFSRSVALGLILFGITVAGQLPIFPSRQWRNGVHGIPFSSRPAISGTGHQHLYRKERLHYLAYPITDRSVCSFFKTTSNPSYAANITATKKRSPATVLRKNGIAKM